MHLSRPAYWGCKYLRKGIANRGCSLGGVLADTQTRRQVLSTSAPAHRMCQMLFIVSHFAMLVYSQMRGQVLSSTASAHRMSRMLFIVFTLWDAGLHPDEGSGALKYRACTQNVSYVIQIPSLRIPSLRTECVPRLRTECVRCYS